MSHKSCDATVGGIFCFFFGEVFLRDNDVLTEYNTSNKIKIKNLFIVNSFKNARSDAIKSEKENKFNQIM